jgi:hypothetical protein
MRIRTEEPLKWRSPPCRRIIAHSWVCAQSIVGRLSGWRIWLTRRRRASNVSINVDNASGPFVADESVPQPAFY